MQDFFNSISVKDSHCSGSSKEILGRKILFMRLWLRTNLWSRIWYADVSQIIPSKGPRSAKYHVRWVWVSRPEWTRVTIMH